MSSATAKPFALDALHKKYFDLKQYRKIQQLHAKIAMIKNGDSLEYQQMYSKFNRHRKLQFALVDKRKANQISEINSRHNEMISDIENLRLQKKVALNEFCIHRLNKLKQKIHYSKRNPQSFEYKSMHYNRSTNTNKNNKQQQIVIRLKRKIKLNALNVEQQTKDIFLNQWRTDETLSNLMYISHTLHNNLNVNPNLNLNQIHSTASSAAHTTHGSMNMNMLNMRNMKNLSSASKNNLLLLSMGSNKRLTRSGKKKYLNNSVSSFMTYDFNKHRFSLNESQVKSDFKSMESNFKLLVNEQKLKREKAEEEEQRERERERERERALQPQTKVSNSNPNSNPNSNGNATSQDNVNVVIKKKQKKKKQKRKKRNERMSNLELRLNTYANIFKKTNLYSFQTFQPRVGFLNHVRVEDYTNTAYAALFDDDMEDEHEYGDKPRRRRRSHRNRNIADAHQSNNKGTTKKRRNPIRICNSSRSATSFSYQEGHIASKASSHQSSNGNGDGANHQHRSGSGGGVHHSSRHNGGGGGGGKHHSSRHNSTGHDGSHRSSSGKHLHRSGSGSKSSQRSHRHRNSSNDLPLHMHSEIQKQKAIHEMDAQSQSQSQSVIYKNECHLFSDEFKAKILKVCPYSEMIDEKEIGFTLKIDNERIFHGKRVRINYVSNNREKERRSCLAIVVKLDKNSLTAVEVNNHKKRRRVWLKDIKNGKIHVHIATALF